MSAEPNKIANTNKFLSSDQMEGCIKQLQQVHGQVSELKQLYHIKCEQLNEIKQCHKLVLLDNVKLKSAVDALSDKIKEIDNGNQTHVECDLFMIIHKAFSEKIHEYENDKNVAFSLLKDYHKEMNDAIMNAIADVMLNKSASQLVQNFKLRFDQAGLKIATRIKYDCESESSLKVSKYFEESTFGTLDKKEDEDENMGQQ